MAKLDLNYHTYMASKEWENRSKFCRMLTCNHCSVFFFVPFKQRVEAHHLTYDNFKNELPFRDLVPLSKFAHLFIHFLQDVLKLVFRKRKQQKIVKAIINNILRCCFFLSFLFWLVFRILYIVFLPLVIFIKTINWVLFRS